MLLKKEEKKNVSVQHFQMERCKGPLPPDLIADFVTTASLCVCLLSMCLFNKCYDK